MTLVDIAMSSPAADGSLVPARGMLRFTPTNRRVLNDTTVLPVSFQVSLTLGVAEVDLAANDLSWVWRIDEHVSGSPSRTIYTNIPDAVSVPYTDLVPLDPVTLAPAPSTDPAWLDAYTQLAAATITPDPDDPGFFLIGAS